MIAVLSDIHGNLTALEAVIADAKVRGCNAFINLGDVLSGPLWPRETADLLMALDWPTISGNHDRELVSGTSETRGRSDAHALVQLDDHHLAWLRALPADYEPSDHIYFCHGNSADDIHYLLHRVEPDRIRDAHAQEIAMMLEDRAHCVIGCGHSHLLRHVVLEDGLQVFNPGSVGLPAYAWDYPHVHRMEQGSTKARYAILAGEGAQTSVELHGVAYDHLAAAARAEANGRLDWAVPLRTGFMD